MVSRFAFSLNLDLRPDKKNTCVQGNPTFAKFTGET